MPPPLRVALAGYGLAGSVFHGPLIAGTPGLELRTVVTGDAGRAAQAAADHPSARVVPRLEDALAGHDLLVVASANRAHAAQARMGLEAGLHVVVDKPVAPDAATAAELAALARRVGRLLMPFHNRRWDSEFLTLRALLDAGELGELLRLESRFCRWRPEPRPESWRESADPADAGGLLLDLGTHLVDQVVVLLGMPRTVYAEIDRRRPGAGPEDDLFIALGYPGGVRAHVWASAMAADTGQRLRALGTRGAYVRDHLDGQEDALRAGARPRPGASWGEEDPARRGWLVRGEERLPVDGRPGAWPAFYAGVEAAVRHGAPAPVDAGDAVAVLRVLEAARSSADQSSIVRL